jgi:hypothetical protein
VPAQGSKDKGELFETLDSVFPYPYRGWLSLLSKSYRAQVQAVYREQSMGFVLVDTVLSLVFFVGETLFVAGLVWLLLF